MKNIDRDAVSNYFLRYVIKYFCKKINWFDWIIVANEVL